MSNDRVIVVGGGIAGLTAAALIAKAGIPVTLLEAHSQTGGCAGTFKRGPYVFDVGATQVAGFEPGGIHERIFRYLQLPLPKAQLLEIACLVDMNDGFDPIRLCYDPQEWDKEWKKHFPGSQSFWTLCKAIHRSNWAFANRSPIVPCKNSWDFLQLLKAFRVTNSLSALFTPFSMVDLLKLCGCEKDARLIKFLDLQLKLYSQEPANRTAALYGATVLQMAQAPLGLWHLHGSMQKLSDLLVESLIDSGGHICLGHRADRIEILPINQQWQVIAKLSSGSELTLTAKDVVCSLPPQSLMKLMPHDSGMLEGYRQRLQKLPKPSGAIVFYGAIERNILPEDCPAHLQLTSSEIDSLFVSISAEGDGRAPAGQATVIASMFAATADWIELPKSIYQKRKSHALLLIRTVLDRYFHCSANSWIHQELATPRSFAKWTGRPEGIVGGLGQHPSRFGVFGLPSRTPMQGLWLCGDSIYPGEGTAGVSHSALMTSRQLMAERGIDWTLPQ